MIKLSKSEFAILSKIFPDTVFIATVTKNGHANTYYCADDMRIEKVIDCMRTEERKECLNGINEKRK